jgi:polar amino acid transport system substrate-binding protein
MKRPLFLISFVAVTMVLLFSQCDKKTDDAYRFKFQFITEIYAPLNYLEGNTLKGLGPDVLKTVCEKLNIPFEVNILPWEEGYRIVQSDDNAVLFCTILNSTRKDLFKWAGPIASLDWIFYTASGDEISLNTLDEAKRIGKIGVLKDNAIEQYLVQQGFDNLVYCTDNIDAFTKLLNGDFDLFPSDKITAEAALKTLGKSIYKINPLITIRTDLVYFAFNKSIPDDVVADIQNAIDAMKKDGTLKTLSEEYLNTSDFPGTLQIYTEQYPPITFRNNFGEITGFGTDIVNEIMKRNKIYTPVRLTSWSSGYDLALNNPNVCLFTMDRTDLRENLFQWVGPIGTNTTWFYTKTGAGIRISSLDEARKLSSVGTVNSWFSTQYLQNLGFTNLVLNSDPSVLAQKLMNGEIDAFVCTGVTFPDILKVAGYHYSEAFPSFRLMASDYYIAFSKLTPESTVNQWQTTFGALKADGTYEAISQKWLK